MFGFWKIFALVISGVGLVSFAWFNSYNNRNWTSAVINGFGLIIFMISAWKSADNILRMAISGIFDRVEQEAHQWVNEMGERLHQSITAWRSWLEQKFYEGVAAIASRLGISPAVRDSVLYGIIVIGALVILSISDAQGHQSSSEGGIGIYNSNDNQSSSGQSMPPFSSQQQHPMLGPQSALDHSSAALHASQTHFDHDPPSGPPAQIYHSQGATAGAYGVQALHHNVYGHHQLAHEPGYDPNYGQPVNISSASMAGLASLIVGFCRSSFNFSSELKVKGLITIKVDQSAITYVDIDETIYRDGHGKLDVAGPHNALQQWKQPQNSGQTSQQNQWPQQLQLQPRVRAERPLSARLQSPSHSFETPQMPIRLRTPAPRMQSLKNAPRMQSPKMSSARMQQACMPQSVLKLNKIPGHLDPSQGRILAAPSVAKSFPTHERLAVAGQNGGQAVGATSGAEVEDSSDQMNDVAHSFGDAEICNQTSLHAVANKNNENPNGNKNNENPNGNLHSQIEPGYGQGSGDNKEPQKKISKMRGGQKTKKAQVKHSEEEKEEEKEDDEESNCQPNRPKVRKDVTVSLPRAAQDTEASADERLASKVAYRKRTKKVDEVDYAKMPKLEKEGGNAYFWNTFATKGAGKNKVVSKKAKL